jgi:hypothetical protein
MWTYIPFELHCIGCEIQVQGMLFSFFFFFFFWWYDIGQATNIGLAPGPVRFGSSDPGKNYTVQRNAQMHAFAGQCGAAGLAIPSTSVVGMVLGKCPATH